MSHVARILVIDDDQAILELVREALSYEGYEILTATDGRRGLDLAAREPPDLILLDMRMPILDGWEPVDPALIAMAQYDLGQRLGLGTPVGDLVSAQPMTWSTTALGCPITGRVYTQMTVQGAKVMLSYQGRYYTYHASAQGTPKVVLCDRLAQSQGVTQ